MPLFRFRLSCVYVITCTANGRSYVGSTIDFSQRHRKHISRLRRGNHESVKLQNAYNKYGEDSFVFTPLVVCDDTELIEIEQKFMDQLDVILNGFNSSPIAGSGMRGRTWSQLQRDQFSQMAKLRRPSAEHKRAISNGLKNSQAPRSPHVIEAMRKASEKVHRFLNPDGAEVEIRNLTQYCRDEFWPKWLTAKSRLTEISHYRRDQWHGWRRSALLLALIYATTLFGCHPSPVLEPAPQEPLPIESATPEPATPDAPPESQQPSIILPPPPLLSPEGHTLILEFETGGRAGYNPHPEWPGGASGVTIGIGYDTGYYSRPVILSDWRALALAPRTRLADAHGLTGQKARVRKDQLIDIFVQWALATDVFDHVDIAREFSSAKVAMPGFEDIRSNAQAAIISLGFNRGWDMSGANRTEMRAIRGLVPARDYEGIAIQFRKMVRVWTGTSIENGMRRRRFAEAKLVETP